jgi:hypothetical protein
MSLPVVLRPEATKDTAEAIGYFDALRPGLGSRVRMDPSGCWQRCRLVAAFG